MNKNTGDGYDIELKRKLQLLKGSNGEYVLSTITDIYALMDLIAQEANKARLVPVSDLAWCLGKLRGLGHPAEHLEKQYDLTVKSVIQNKLEGLQ